MISIVEYKSKYIDRMGTAPAVLLNLDGESLHLPEVYSVTNTKGRMKLRWRALDVPDQWHDYTHIALIGADNVQHIAEITPVNLDGKASNVEITFYE